MAFVGSIPTVSTYQSNNHKLSVLEAAMDERAVHAQVGCLVLTILLILGLVLSVF
jgi:hypothetical protein